MKVILNFRGAIKTLTPVSQTQQLADYEQMKQNEQSISLTYNTGRRSLGTPLWGHIPLHDFRADIDEVLALGCLWVRVPPIQYKPVRTGFPSQRWQVIALFAVGQPAGGGRGSVRHAGVLSLPLKEVSTLCLGYKLWLTKIWNIKKNWIIAGKNAFYS